MLPTDFFSFVVQVGGKLLALLLFDSLGDNYGF
jgi:hypothetical protein